MDFDGFDGFDGFWWWILMDLMDSSDGFWWILGHTKGLSLVRESPIPNPQSRFSNSPIPNPQTPKQIPNRKKLFLLIQYALLSETQRKYKM